MNKRLPSVRGLSSDDGPRDQDGALYRFLVESLTEYAVFAVSPAGIVISWNSGAQTTFGYTQAEIVGRSFDVIFTAHDAEIGAPQAELDGALSGGKTHYDRWHVRKDGSRFWGINTVQPLYDRGGRLLGFTKLVRDTTHSHLAVEELSDSEQQLRLLIESVRDFAIFSVGIDGTVTNWSTGAQRVFGYPQAEIVGRNFSALFSAADVAAGFPRAELHDAGLNESIDVERWLVRKDGSAFLASGKTSQLKASATGDLRGFVKLVHDTTEGYLAAQEMRRRAQCDALTGLPNRETFYEHVQRAIAILKRHSSDPFAILFIDLDRFKAVNDEFGHIIADTVLSLIARRLEKCVRAGDIVSRVGGDEFAVLLNGIHGAVDADDAVQRIVAGMHEPVTTEVGDVFATVSVGIALGSPNYDSPQDIMRDADAAMYVAKTQGRGRAVVFDRSIGQARCDSVDLTTALRHAIDRNELRIAYQPVLRLTDMAVVGFEALVRWKHPRRGLLLPSNFIPAAEDSNLVVSIDRWVLAQACRQLANWQTRGIAGPDLQMSVNVASKEFSREEFLADIRDVLAASAIAATSLRLEITEGTILERAPRAYQTLAAVRALGVCVDVDDFGTGYASLSALNHIFVDGLKIDWSFVTNANAHHGWEIVESVISLAHKLGLVAIAEGIETGDQLGRLIALGCDFGQGYLFAPALGAVAAAAYLRERKPGAQRQPPPSGEARCAAGRIGAARAAVNRRAARPQPNAMDSSSEAETNPLAD
jgi:diguanylate cyclase (GGDEF)-like protein/PAS domain S-box-containing protein